MFSRFSKILLNICCAFSFVIPTYGTQFEKCIGRISYMLDSTKKTASINKVFSYWEGDSKVFLPAFVKFNGALFKVVKLSKGSLKALLVDISEINVPHTILKTAENKKVFAEIFDGLDEISKATIEDFFET